MSIELDGDDFVDWIKNDASPEELVEQYMELYENCESERNQLDRRINANTNNGVAYCDTGKVVIVNRELAVKWFESALADFDEENSN